MASAAADGGNDPDLTSCRQTRRKTARISGVFISYEQIDVLPDPALLRQQTVPQTGILAPESLQGITKSRWRRGYLNLSVPGCKRTQRTWYVNRDGQ